MKGFESVLGAGRAAVRLQPGGSSLAGGWSAPWRAEPRSPRRGRAQGRGRPHHPDAKRIQL